MQCAQATLRYAQFFRDSHIMNSRKLITPQEASTNTVNLTEDGLDLVSRLVDSLYLGTYDDFKTEEDAEHWKSAHELHAAMFALGDKYDCTVLRETALAKFKEYTAKDDTQSVLGLIASVPFVYSSTPDSERTLREVIANRIRPKAARFIQKDVSWPFSKMMLANPKLGGDVHRWGKPCLQLLCCGLVPALRAPRQTITRRRKIIGS